ncbi:hypothetical protein J4477_02615 [Candidatus Pacearchaeota archaeon]|nr:hypothetical protein [Candidatus Pacearchaeota archaeon]
MNVKRINELYTELEVVAEGLGGLDNNHSQRIVRQIGEEIGLNFRTIHDKISETHGEYSDFESLTREYSNCLNHQDTIGAINVINKYRNQVIEAGELHWLPIFASLDRHFFCHSVQLSGFGIHDAYKMTAEMFR